MPQMTKLKEQRETVTINAPAQTIYPFLSRVETVVALLPGMTPTGRSNGGVVADISVHPLGIPIDVPFSDLKISITDAQEPTSVTVVLDGSSGKGALRFTLQPQRDGTTCVVLDASHQMSINVISDALNSAGAIGAAAGGIGSSLGEIPGVSTFTVDQVIRPLQDANTATVRQMLANLKNECERTK